LLKLLFKILDDAAAALLDFIPLPEQILPELAVLAFQLPPMQQLVERRRNGGAAPHLVDVLLQTEPRPGAR
jgi:hypothetical protein